MNADAKLCPQCSRADQGASHPTQPPTLLDFVLIDGVYRWPFEWVTELIREEEITHRTTEDSGDV